jgi:hypothetical protein
MTKIGTHSARECGICFENPAKKRSRYGLLTSCDHLFCLDCMKQWRSPAQHHTDTTTAQSQRKTCPLCRAKSDFIVPSFDFKVGDDKLREVEKFRAKCAEIPCQFYRECSLGGSCPFGAKCFYKHIRDDGTVVDKSIEAEQGERGGVPGKRRARRAARRAEEESNMRGASETAVVREIVADVMGALAAAERAYGVSDGPTNRGSSDLDLVTRIVSDEVLPIPDSSNEEVVSALLNIFAESAAAAARCTLR